MVQKSSTIKDAVPMRASTQSVWTNETKDTLVRTVENYDLRSKPEWGKLDELSSRTEFEGLQVFPDDTIFDGQSFVAPGTVYVKLNYDSASEEPVVFSESFPTRIVFEVSGSGEVQVRHFDVDTSSFFDGDDQAAQ